MLKKSFHFCYDFEQKSTKLLLKESWYATEMLEIQLQNAVDIQSYTFYELHFQWPFLYLEHLEHISR